MAEMRTKDAGKQWDRVTGADLNPNKKALAERNKSTLTNPVFIKACEAVNIPPSKRQASKWNNKMGKARKGF